MPTNKRFIFFGTDTFVVPVLETLLTLPYECVGVVTAPDRKGRGSQIIPSPVKQCALKRGLKVFTPEKLKDFFDTYQGLAPDFAVIASYGKIISQKFIDATPLGILNIHPSLLPRHRGPSPVPATILAGDTMTGVAIMKIDAGVDTGDILAMEEHELSGTETTPQLLDELFIQGAQLLAKTLDSYLAGSLLPHEQPGEGATHSSMLQKDDGKLDFTESAEVVERKVRALNPWPGTFAQLSGQRIKILSVRLTEKLKKALTPGTIQQESDQLFVGTGTSPLEILELQKEGKTKQSAAEFIRGLQNKNDGLHFDL